MPACCREGPCVKAVFAKLRFGTSLICKRGSMSCKGWKAFWDVSHLCRETIDSTLKITFLLCRMLAEVRHFLCVFFSKLNKLCFDASWMHLVNINWKFSSILVFLMCNTKSTYLACFYLYIIRWHITCNITGYMIRSNNLYSLFP